MRSQLATLDRLRRIAQTLIRHGLLGLVDQIGLGDGSLIMRHPPAELAAARYGRRLSRALNDLGPTFIKLGQFLSTREDLFSAPMARELAQLQDGARPLEVGIIKRRIAESLGRPVEQAFAWFDDEPLAAGSIAQVHRARTESGREVVVKVCRPGIERDMERDLTLLASLARRAAARSPDIARIDPVGLVEELGANLRLELDFAREARCLRDMREVVAGTAHVPEVVAELSTQSVLTMEWVDAVKLGSPPAAADARAAARALVACFATQYLRGTMFHADPHPGNLMWTADGRLVLLDLGATGTVDAAMRRMLFRLSVAAVRRDGERLAEVALAMVHVPPDLDRVAYRRDLGAVLDGAIAGLAQIRIAELVRDVFAVAQRHRVRVRSEYFALFRSAMLVDGVLRRLDPSLDPVVETRRYMVRNLFTRRWFAPAASLTAQTMALRAVRLVRGRGRLRPALVVSAVVAALAVAVWAGVGSGGDGQSARAEQAPVFPGLVAPTAAVLPRDCPLRGAPRPDDEPHGVVLAGATAELRQETRLFWRVRTAQGAEGYIPKSCLDGKRAPP
ncbi:MAG TPA: AarF/UbiB family protein [Kofleriaceae bacterium]|nr:AarF/UbiB family protein [Kofleriaceae bacterium]